MINTTIVDVANTKKETILEERLKIKQM